MKNILKNKLLASGVLVVSTVSGQAMAAGVTDPIFGAIDFTTVAASVSAVGVLIIGIAMVMKSITLGKRAVDKA